MTEVDRCSESHDDEDSRYCLPDPVPASPNTRQELAWKKDLDLYLLVSHGLV